MHAEIDRNKFLNPRRWINRRKYSVPPGENRQNNNVKLQKPSMEEKKPWSRRKSGGSNKEVPPGKRTGHTHLWKTTHRPRKNPKNSEIGKKKLNRCSRCAAITPKNKNAPKGKGKKSKKPSSEKKPIT